MLRVGGRAADEAPGRYEDRATRRLLVEVGVCDVVPEDLFDLWADPSPRREIDVSRLGLETKLQPVPTPDEVLAKLEDAVDQGERVCTPPPSEVRERQHRTLAR